MSNPSQFLTPDFLVLALFPLQLNDAVSFLNTSGFEGQVAVIAATGAAAFASLAAAMRNARAQSQVLVEDTPEVKPETIDISIPYDAAALLAFEEWKGEADFDAFKYKKFKNIYETKTVAEVSLKKVQRDVAETLNKAEGDLLALKN